MQSPCGPFPPIEMTMSKPVGSSALLVRYKVLSFPVCLELMISRVKASTPRDGIMRRLVVARRPRTHTSSRQTGRDHWQRAQTGIQVVPHLGRWAKDLYVFQRTPSSVDVRTTRPRTMHGRRRLASGWQRKRQENFAIIIAGGHADEDLVAMDD